MDTETQAVVITYYFGDEATYARVLTEQTVARQGGVTLSTERSADYTLAFSGLSEDMQADFAAVYSAGDDWLDAFLARHGLTLGSGSII